MKMKYFQAIADIENHYQDILRYMDNEGHGHMLLETWGIGVSEKEQIIEEKEMLRYLIGCQLDLVRESNAKKPSIDVVNRCLKRQLAFLESVHNCHAYNVNKHRLPTVRKKYKACRHYLFKFTQKAWVEKLPNEILTFENKYGKVL